MMIPVRCYTCNKVIGHLYEYYKILVEKNIKSEDIFNEIELKRYCCKRMFISHIDLIDKIINYK
jgi:DNA-directed RNA polymerase subunit N (RpoN/RPB10)